MQTWVFDSYIFDVACNPVVNAGQVDPEAPVKCVDNFSDRQLLLKPMLNCFYFGLG